VKKTFSDIREASWKLVTREGLARNEQLPLLDDVEIKVTEPQVAARLLCMYAVAATAFGFKAQEAKRWLDEEGLTSELSKPEKLFLDGDATQLFTAQLQVHSSYSLAWCSNLVSEQRLMGDLPDDFVSCFPDIRLQQSTKSFIDRVKLRDVMEVLPLLDHAYCLHWALRDAELRMQKTPNLRWLHSVEAHRHALEWLVAGGSWEDVAMDT
jgi:hypothetical protein